MGGNALRNAVTRRYAAGEYNKILWRISQELGGIFPLCRFEAIKAYRQKDSFGDMDVVIESDNLPSNWQELLIDLFNLRREEWVKNGNVFSFAYRQLQIDLIVTPSENYQTSLNYFAWNDLGNLLGRVAHQMGVRLGHTGLSYQWRIDETQHFRTVVIEKDWSKILPVLGYDYERWAAGFDTVEDIFEFVVSSPYFNKDIYLLHNRNHTSRVRDAKRKTYTEFLKWIEGYGETVEQQFNRDWVAYNRNQFSHKRFWLPYLFNEMPHFKTIYDEVQAEWDLAVEYKRRFNGEIVMRVTGLQGKELGNFMKWLREYYGDEKMKRDVLKLNPGVIEPWVKHFYMVYTDTLPKLEINVLDTEQHRVK